MKIKFLIFLFLVIFIINLNAETISVLKVINLNGKKKYKNVSDILFGRKKKNLIRPGSIFQLKEGLLGITDQVNGSIVIFDSEGKVKKKILSFKKIRIISPVSGTSNEQGEFFISDSSLRLILKFRSDFKFEKIFVLNIKRRITGINFFKGKLFCTDSGNHEIVVYKMNGKELFSFGKRGSAPGEFNFPTHIAVDNDFIYITDALNFRIQIFDHKGGFIRKFGRNGRRGGEFSKPKGIAIDRKKRIFVTDVIFDNVQVFDIQGRFLNYFGAPGAEKGEFWMPSGIMVDKTDKVNVADTYNNRIQVFKISTE